MGEVIMKSVEKKQVYAEPSIIDVGSVESLTAGHGTPVGDPPHDGTTGYYDASKNLGNAEIDLSDC
jgi:hypothetical protein